MEMDKKIEGKPISKGEDYWGRGIYEFNGELYVEVDGELHTIERSAGYEEPGYPIGRSV